MLPGDLPLPRTGGGRRRDIEMRKPIVKFLPAPLFLAFLAMTLLAFVGCGGDGGGGIAAGGGADGGGGGSAVTLTGLSINGPSSMNAPGTSTYTATASWSDNSTSTVTPTWGVNSYVASISPEGVLSCNSMVAYNEPATITATYSSGGITRTATMDVTITNADKTLTGLSIGGPSSMNEGSAATYIATASWSDNSTSTVTPTWSASSYAAASISPGGVLSCPQVFIDEPVWVTATYSSGGITRTATKVVTIVNITAIPPTPPIPFPFTAHNLSGMTFFEEKIDAGGVYHSNLYVFNADFSLRQYRYQNPPDTSDSVTGTWSIGGSGDVILNYAGGKSVTVVVFDNLLIYSTLVSVDDGSGTPYIVRWEPCGPGLYPFRAVLQGTYVDQYGDKWIFNADGTGSTAGEGGSTFTWSVDAGILKVVFATGHVGWMYERSSSRPTMGPMIIKLAYVEYTPAGDFYFYYGGLELTPQ
jgi:hypothetical protein